MRKKQPATWCCYGFRYANQALVVEWREASSLVLRAAGSILPLRYAQVFGQTIGYLIPIVTNGMPRAEGNREFLWEGHTAHATKEDADKEILEALDHYHHIYEEYFAVPVVKSMKSEKKFAGARYTTNVEKLVVVYKVKRCLTSHSQIKKETIKGVAEFLGL
ncbi:unnamed protein product [Brassica oleracea]